MRNPIFFVFRFLKMTRQLKSKVVSEKKIPLSEALKRYVSPLNLQISFICVCQYLHSIFIMIEIFSSPHGTAIRTFSLSLASCSSRTPESFFSNNNNISSYQLTVVTIFLPHQKHHHTHNSMKCVLLCP